MIWLFFALIQLINLPLMVVGWFVCLLPSLAHRSWIWWNDDDPPLGFSWWRSYVWLAWRNPVSNLRHVPFVSGAGRPLIYYWRTSTPDDIKSGHYIKVGWESGAPHYPVMSAGSGRGY